jgi:hypothetical protein
MYDGVDRRCIRQLLRPYCNAFVVVSIGGACDVVLARTSSGTVRLIFYITVGRRLTKRSLEDGATSLMFPRRAGMLETSHAAESSERMSSKSVLSHVL